MVKRRFLPGLMAAVAALAVAGPVMAQGGGDTGQGGTGGGTETASSNQRTGNDDTNWGWLGLLGLAGLAGLRRPSHNAPQQDRPNNARAF